MFFLPLAELCLEDFSNYRFLSSGNMTIPGLQDTDLFAETVEAFKIMNIPEDERIGTFLTRCVWWVNCAPFGLTTFAFICSVCSGVAHCQRCALTFCPSSVRSAEGGVCCAPAGQHDFQEGASFRSSVHARRHRCWDTHARSVTQRHSNALLPSKPTPV